MQQNPIEAKRIMNEKDVVSLTHDVLSISHAQKAVEAPNAGGISLFVGTTRNNFNGKRVTWLEYEAYEAMAVKQMETLCISARLKWPQLVKIAIFHRLGRVPIGEASVIIAVSSPHRRESIGTLLSNNFRET